jgi:hypothetical protein
MPDQYLSPTPQEPISGALAAALQKVLDYTQRKDPSMPGGLANPVLPHIADLLMLPQVQRTLDRVSYGDRLTQGSGETLQIKPDTLDTAMAAAPLAGALKKALPRLIEAMPSSSASFRSSQRGAITVGGDPDLYPYHGTGAEKLLDAIRGSKVPELSGPSIGISKGGVDLSFAHGPGGGVVLIPRVGAYDPATSPSTLFNRDAYTPRDRYVEPYSTNSKVQEQLQHLEERRLLGSFGVTREQLRESGLRGEASTRNDYRLSPKLPSDLRAREFVETSTGNWTHDEAIKGSPIFRSFKQFENSPLGSALLMDKRAPSELTDGAIERWQGQGALDKVFGKGFTDTLNRPRSPWDSTVSGDELSHSIANYYKFGLDKHGVTFDKYLSQNAPNLRQAAFDWGSTPDHLNQAARAYRGLLKQTPSQYAELKVAGPTQLSPENWAGAVMLHAPLRSRGGGLSFEQDKLFDTLPFPVVPHDFSQSDEVLTRLVQALQQQAGPARKQSLGTSYLPYLNNPP